MVNKEKYLKTYLYTLVGKELTYEDKEKILSYVNDIQMAKDGNKKRYAIILTSLESRIDKAIRYIRKETKDMPTNGCKIRLEKVVDILYGVDKWVQ